MDEESKEWASRQIADEWLELYQTASIELKSALVFQWWIFGVGANGTDAERAYKGKELLDPAREMQAAVDEDERRRRAAPIRHRFIDRR